RDVIIVDGGSRDGTLEIAEHAGATIVHAPRGRGIQMNHGVAQAKADWFLFLHADTVLEPGWEREVAAFVQRVESGQRDPAAAAFRFALDDLGFRPRLLESAVAMRCALFRLPYGDQGLLIPRSLYHEVGGFAPRQLMEDIDIVRRLKREQMIIMRSQAVTSAIRYRREGYVRRSARNFACLMMYYCRVPERYIERMYG
ncbi:MAG: TIGR04283 family arsenosugar biosynthesis glycosyltransferase, partial [Pseudomonadota bacterium]